MVLQLLTTLSNLDSNNFNASDEVVIHINLDSLGFEQLRLDVYQNWLTFLGMYRAK